MPEEVEFTKDPDHSQMPWKADHDHPVWMEGGHIEGQEPGSFYSAGEQRHIWIEADGKAGQVALVLCDEGDEEALANVHLIERAPALLSIVEEAIPFLERLLEYTGGDTVEGENLVMLLDDAHRISAFARRGAP